MEENVQSVSNDIGTIKITDEVVAIIAGIAAMEVPGVTSMALEYRRRNSRSPGKKNLSKGVKVEVGEKGSRHRPLYHRQYGYRIPEAAWTIQERVKNAVEDMTGLSVVEVNIHVQGVNIEREYKRELLEEQTKSR